MWINPATSCHTNKPSVYLFSTNHISSSAYRHVGQFSSSRCQTVLNGLTTHALPLWTLWLRQSWSYSGCNRNHFNKLSNSANKGKRCHDKFVMWNPMTELRHATCNTGSHNITFHPALALNTTHLNPSQEGWYSIYLPRRDGRLSWPSEQHPGWETNPRPL